MRATHALRNLVRHTLAAPSPLIKSRGPVVPLSSLPASLADDFAIYPDFFSPSESRALLQLALWKLDRVDSKRKRRRRGAASETDKEKEKAPCKAQLQDLFVGPYGFEEVGWAHWLTTLARRVSVQALILYRDTSTR